MPEETSWQWLEKVQLKTGWPSYSFTASFSYHLAVPAQLDISTPSQQLISKHHPLLLLGRIPIAPWPL